MGALSGITAIGRLQPVLVRTPTWRRWRLEFATVAGAASAASVLALLAQLADPRAMRPAVRWDVLVPALFVTILQLAAMAVALLRVAPLPSGARPIVLAALACVLPAIAPGACASLALVRASQDFQHTRTSAGSTASAHEIEPILAWLAAALLLEVAHARRA